MGARTQLTFGREPVTSGAFQPGDSMVVYYRRDVGGSENWQIYRLDRRTGQWELPHRRQEPARGAGPVAGWPPPRLRRYRSQREGHRRLRGRHGPPPRGPPALRGRGDLAAARFHPRTAASCWSAATAPSPTPTCSWWTWPPARAARSPRRRARPRWERPASPTTGRPSTSSPIGTATSASSTGSTWPTRRLLPAAHPHAALERRGAGRGAGRIARCAHRERGRGQPALLPRAAQREAGGRGAAPGRCVHPPLPGGEARIPLPGARHAALAGGRLAGDAGQEGPGALDLLGDGGIDPATLAEPTLVRYPSRDGTSIPAWLYLPPGQGKRPVVVSWHGGPEAQERPTFQPVAQLLVQGGIAVLIPNVRGSDGYGKAYLAMDDGVKREDSLGDIGATLDWIASRPDLDPGRVGVYGGLVRWVHGARHRRVLPVAHPLGRGRGGHLQHPHVPRVDGPVSTGPAARRVRRRARSRGSRRPGAHLAAQQGRRHHGRALRHPGEERPARAAERGRADRGRGAGEGEGGLVPAGARRGARIPEEGEPRLPDRDDRRVPGEDARVRRSPSAGRCLPPAGWSRRSSQQSSGDGEGRWMASRCAEAFGPAPRRALRAARRRATPAGWR